MLQERLYPRWAPALRVWWRHGYRRIVLFWIFIVLSTVMVVMVISTDWIRWDNISLHIFHTSELSRAFLASTILVIDLTIVIQDWDFPHFVNSFDIKLPGLTKSNFNFSIFSHIHVHITGKWFNYGILFFVLILDMNMWKNQILYVPIDFGQYTGPDHRIYTPLDALTLSNPQNLTFYNFLWRNATVNPLTNKTYISTDGMTHSQYYHVSLAVKAIAFIPNIVMILTFITLVVKFGRNTPSDSNPYLGRLKKKRFRRRELDKKDVSEDSVDGTVDEDEGRTGGDNVAVFKEAVVEESVNDKQEPVADGTVVNENDASLRKSIVSGKIDGRRANMKKGTNDKLSVKQKLTKTKGKMRRKKSSTKKKDGNKSEGTKRKPRGRKRKKNRGLFRFKRLRKKPKRRKSRSRRNSERGSGVSTPVEGTSQAIRQRSPEPTKKKTKGRK